MTENERQATWMQLVHESQKAMKNRDMKTYNEIMNKMKEVRRPMHLNMNAGR